MTIDRPSLPVPDSLRGREFGTFTHESITVRLPDIGRRMLAENTFAPETVARLNRLIDGIPDDQVRLLKDPAGPDAAAWNGYLEPYLGQDWLQAPWFVVETYFYRRILEETGYFTPGPGHLIDPFLYQKRQGLEASRVAIGALSARVLEMMSVAKRADEALAELLAIALWGNQADLSLWPADGEDKPDHQDVAQQQAHTLVDDTPIVLDHMLGRGVKPGRVDLILDNASFELVADLYLAAYLLEMGVAQTVVLHAKAHPTFVSDTLVKDVMEAITYLADRMNGDAAALAGRLRQQIAAGRLRLTSDWFWTSPLEMWRMPALLRDELVLADLLISKGDANYRRLLGDRHWPLTTPFAAIVSYMPVPLLALRTSKSEVMAGLATGQAEIVTRQDPDWLFDGRWGVIQFVTSNQEI